MFGKLFGLFGKLISLALLAVVVGLFALAGYFYYKSGEPMQVAEAQRLAPGITFREYLQFQYANWKQVDDKSVSQGKNGSCVLVLGVINHFAILVFSPFQVNHFIAIRGTPAFSQYVEYLNGTVPPDKLLSAPWWKLPEAYWWQVVNSSWFTSYRSAGTCRIHSLSPSAHSQTSKP